MSQSYSRLGLLFLGSLVGAALGGSAVAQPKDATEPATVTGASSTTGQSPFFGRWELDLQRTSATDIPGQKRVTYEFEDAGSGKWLTKIDITAQDGGVRHIAVQYRQDGQAAQGEGDKSIADSAAVNSPATNILVMSLAKDNGLASVHTYAVSDDGNEMTESAADVDDRGAPFVHNFHFHTHPLTSRSGGAVAPLIAAGPLSTNSGPTLQGRISSDTQRAFFGNRCHRFLTRPPAGWTWPTERDTIRAKSRFTVGRSGFPWRN